MARPAFAERNAWQAMINKKSIFCYFYSKMPPNYRFFIQVAF
jgi:hypothetical protein